MAAPTPTPQGRPHEHPGLTHRDAALLRTGVTPAELDTIRALATSLPTRAQIAEALCRALDWRRPDGATKAMSARVACLRMAADGLITLPPPRNTNGNGRVPCRRTRDPERRRPSF